MFRGCKMSDELVRVLDSVAKGYECADVWVRRYETLFAEYTALNARCEENRNHGQYTIGKYNARVSELEDLKALLETTVSELKSKIEKLATERLALYSALGDSRRSISNYKRRESVRMGMVIFDLGDGE